MICVDAIVIVYSQFRRLIFYNFANRVIYLKGFVEIVDFQADIIASYYILKILFNLLQVREAGLKVLQYLTICIPEDVYVFCHFGSPARQIQSTVRSIYDASSCAALRSLPLLF
jgi:hypothetical protein